MPNFQSAMYESLDEQAITDPHLTYRNSQIGLPIIILILTFISATPS